MVRRLRRPLTERQLWLLLLLVAQLADVASTAFGNLHGTVEANPTAAHVLGLGGFHLLGLVKVVGVGVLATLLMVTHRRAALHPSRWTRALYGTAWGGVQVVAMVMTAAAVSNTALITFLFVTGVAS